MNVELLVSLVSEHKELYDKRDSDYKNLDKREMLWSVIAEQMVFDVFLYDFDKRVNTCSLLLSDMRVSEA